MDKFEELKNELDQRVSELSELKEAFEKIREDINSAKTENNAVKVGAYGPRLPKGSMYYYLYGIGLIGYSPDDHDELDDWHFESGNYYYTAEAAENGKKFIVALAGWMRIAGRFPSGPCGIDSDGDSSYISPESPLRCIDMEYQNKAVSEFKDNFNFEDLFQYAKEERE